MSLTLNCTLLCASGASYDINPLTGIYTPDAVFSPAVAYTVPPTAISGDQINACLVGQTSIGIVVAFRGTIPPGDPDSFPDWLQDFFAEPVSAPGLPGLVHSGFMDALNSLIAGVVNAVKACSIRKRTTGRKIRGTGFAGPPRPGEGQVSMKLTLTGEGRDRSV